MVSLDTVRCRYTLEQIRVRGSVRQHARSLHLSRTHEDVCLAIAMAALADQHSPAFAIGEGKQAAERYARLPYRRRSDSGPKAA